MEELLLLSAGVGSGIVGYVFYLLLNNKLSSSFRVDNTLNELDNLETDFKIGGDKW